MKIVITGATGLLGRSVLRTAQSKFPDAQVIGMGYSRASAGIVKLNLCDFDAAREYFLCEKPDAVVHCAAERRPDVAQADPTTTTKINSETTGYLARLGAELGFFLVYISTDYAFDGTRPPYEVTDKPKPINFYGRTKVDGENALMAANGPSTILRIPVLYGDTLINSESSINILVDAVQNTSKNTTMDHYAVRFPSNVSDVARVILDLVELAVVKQASVPKILHFSAQESFTKYEMSLLFAKILGIQTSHLIPQPDPPVAAVDRPRDCRMSLRALKDTGISIDAVGFEDWWRQRLGRAA